MQIEWETAVVRDIHTPQQQQQQQQQGEGTCGLDGSGLFLPPQTSLEIDVAKTCTTTRADTLYSSSYAAEFIIEPQEVAVSHEAIRQRRQLLGTIRLKALKASLMEHWGRKKLTSLSKRQKRRWSSRIDTVYKHSWQQFLSSADPWVR